MEKRIIEINGVKLEVDLTQATVIENYKVGDNIKVLVKDYSSYKSYIGTIIGFDNFETLPTVVISYLKTAYNEASIEFVYFNKESKDVEITHLNNWDIPVTKNEVLKQFEKEITKAKDEIQKIENKRNIFEKLFGKYFEMVSKQTVTEEL